MYYLLNKDKSIIKVSRLQFEGSVFLKCNPKQDYDGKSRPSMFCNEEKLKQLITCKGELSKLERWFSSYFDKQLIESMWQPDFKPSPDPILNVSYLTIHDVKEKANEVRARIKELRNTISTIVKGD